MEKLNLFQLSHRGNIFAGIILNWTKTRTFWFFIGTIVAIFAYSIYDSYQRELFYAKQQRIVDSLGVEMVVKQRQYSELELQAKNLDSLLTEERKRLTVVNQTFNQFSRPPLNNKDSAGKYILNFIRN